MTPGSLFPFPPGYSASFSLPLSHSSMVAKTPSSRSKRPAAAPEDAVTDAAPEDVVADEPGDDEPADEPTELAARDAREEADDPAETGPVHAAAVRLLEDAVDPVARAMGYEVVLLEWAGGRGGRIARIYLDHPNGITLDDCTRMSRIFSSALDAAEADPEVPALAALLAQPYTLEVSSPGVDRPLVRLSHFARHVGGRAVVRTHAPIVADSDQKTFHGHIAGSEVDPVAPTDDRRGTVLLRVLDGDIIHAIALTDIKRANLVFELAGPQPRPSHGGVPKASKPVGAGKRVKPAKTAKPNHSRESP